jgi:hypothetical protein
MKTYFLTCGTIDFNGELEIDKSAFESIENARTTLTSIKDFEEVYDLLIQCFYKVEESFAAALIKFSLGIEERDYFEMHRRRLSLNLEIMSLLSSFRIYRDHNKKNLLEGINKYFKDKNYHLIFESPDEVLFVESFRNYVQHHGMPVEGINLSMSHLDSESDTYVTECVGDITMNVDTCLNSHNFSDSVDFIKKFSGKISLRARFREYISNLSSLHLKIRAEVSELAEHERGVVEQFQLQYQSSTVYQGNLNSIVAKVRRDGEVEKSISLFLLWDDVRQQLELVNRKVGKLGNRYISTRKTND